MTAGEDEAITATPSGVGGVVPQVLGPEHVAQWRQGHRGTGVAGVRPLHGIHGQRPDGVDAKLVEGRGPRHDGSGHDRGSPLVGWGSNVAR